MDDVMVGPGDTDATQLESQPVTSREPSGARRFTLSQAHHIVVSERLPVVPPRDDDTPLHTLGDDA